MRNPLTLVTETLQRRHRARAMAPLANDLHEAWLERGQRPLSPQERELVCNALTLSSVTAGDICVPRTDIRAVPAKAGHAQVVKAFTASKHSRLPVHGKNLDDIVGVITLKDMVNHTNDPSGFTLTAAMHPPVFVPESMPVPRVLQHMRRHRVGLAMVTDEYGGIAGLLTLNDALGELVGEVVDEGGTHTVAHGIQSVGGGRFRVPAGMALEDVAANLSIALPTGTEEISTFGGLVLHHARRVPKPGETVELPEGMTVRILTGDARRIELLELQLPQNRATKQA